MEISRHLCLTACVFQATTCVDVQVIQVFLGIGIDIRGLSNASQKVAERMNNLLPFKKKRKKEWTICWHLTNRLLNYLGEADNWQKNKSWDMVVGNYSVLCQSVPVFMYVCMYPFSTHGVNVRQCKPFK